MKQGQRWRGTWGGSSGLSLLQAAKAGMTLILEKGLDHKLELEADREGTKYGVNAGYQPDALLQYLQRLESGKSKVNMKVLGTTHPSIEQRIANIQTALAGLNAREIVGANGQARFVKFQQQLPKPMVRK